MNLFERKLKTLRFELDNKHNKEFKEFCEIHRNNGTYKSSRFFDLRSEMKENHFKNFLDIVILALKDSFPTNTLIDELGQLDLENTLKKYSISFIDNEKKGLRSVLLSYGYNDGDSILVDTLTAYANKLNLIKSNAGDLLSIAIDNHNNNVEATEPKNQFSKIWDKYGTQITIGIIVTVISGIILSFII